jgi:uncharacterized membrane protein YjgN (DUF898 family)
MTVENAPAAQIALAEAAAFAPAPSAPARPIRFVGDSKAFWRLLIRGAALLAVTLGIYRFWLATDVRRFLWSNTEIAGDNLEYNGTATELLIGFLIAIALLLPLNLLVFLAALGMGPVGEFAGVLAFPLLFVLGQFAIFRARRYRLTRTVLRGVRCHQTGSAWRYAFCATFWWVLIVLTLGLAYPFAQASLERYKMRHTHYGDLPGGFEGSGFRLFLRGLLMWLLVVGPFMIGIGAAIGAVDWDALNRITSLGGGGDITQVEGLAAGGFIALTAVSLSVLMVLLLFPVFQAMVLRWWLSGIRFGELKVTSHLLKRRIYGAYVRFLWYGFLFSLLAGAIGTGVLLAFGVSSNPAGGIAGEIAGTVATVALYVIVMLGYSTIYQATVKLALWRHGLESVEIEGLDVLDKVQAAGSPGSAVGEGLADALNVGGI